MDTVLVGCGKMGSALVRGAVDAGALEAHSLRCVDVDSSRAQRLARELGATASAGSARPDASSMFIFALKPGDMNEAVSSFTYQDGDLVVSIAAGVTLSQLRAWTDGIPNLVRSMPNTPALVRRGVTGVFTGDDFDMAPVVEVFESVGEVLHLHDEHHFDALTALSGSGPAYVFTAIEALADGGVLMGLDRATAVRLATQTIIGAGTLAAESERHTADLKDQVTSPGGTTIAGLAALEANGFRHALIEAVRAAAERSRELGE